MYYFRFMSEDQKKKKKKRKKKTDYVFNLKREPKGVM